MNSNLIKHININLLKLFILLQPFVNIIRDNIVNDIQFFGLSLFEIINVMIIGISFILTFILKYKDKRFVRIILVYFLIFIIYSIFHSMNIYDFNKSVYENSEPSFLKETYYLIITFVVPTLYCILLIFSGITKREILRLIKILTFIITNVIVISNIFSFSHTAYQTNLDHSLSIFNWLNFKNTSYYAYYSLTSIGLFSSGNQFSAILFLIAPVLMYSAYKEGKFINYYLLFMISLTMLMIGTKTSSLGILLIYIMFIALYVFFKLLKNENGNIKGVIILFIITSIIFCFSPFSYNIRYTLSGNKSMTKLEQLQNNPEELDEENAQVLKEYEIIKNQKGCYTNESTKKDFINFFKNNLSYLGIPEYVLKNYSINKHAGFWCNYIFERKSNDYRDLKTDILRNIYKENNNKYDKLLGMGRTLNFIYTESDYFYQFYHYGIIGMIVLFGMYVYFILKYVFDILKNFKTKFNFENVIVISSPILIFGVAYFSGHVFERIFPLIILSILISYNYCKDDKEKDKNKLLFISSTGGHLNEMLQLEPIFSNYNSYIITEKTKSTISLKKKYEKVDYLIYGTKDHKLSYFFKFIINCFMSVYLYLKIRPDVIVSTGTHTAVPICYISKIFGTKIIYIETFANSKTRTLAGRLVYPIADTFIVQWEDMLKFYPKAKFFGWIY